MKRVLDSEDARRKGLIGATYEKLSEVAADLSRAESLIGENTQFIEECERLKAKWEEKTRKDCEHIQERIESIA